VLGFYGLEFDGDFFTGDDVDSEVDVTCLKRVRKGGYEDVAN
jgi:hypothetical protein